MVALAEDSPWSSHQTYLAKESIPWLSVETVLSQLSPQADRAKQLFGELVADQIDEGYRKEFHGKSGYDSRVYGDDAYVAQTLIQAEQEPLQRPALALVINTAREFSFRREEP